MLNKCSKTHFARPHTTMSWKKMSVLHSDVSIVIVKTRLRPKSYALMLGWQVSSRRPDFPTIVLLGCHLKIYRDGEWRGNKTKIRCESRQQPIYFTKSASFYPNHSAQIALQSHFIYLGLRLPISVRRALPTFVESSIAKHCHF